MSASNNVPQYDRLVAALDANGRLDVDYTLNPALLDMFRKRSAEPPECREIVVQRFEKAKALCRGIKRSDAVFYSIRNLEALTEGYEAEGLRMATGIDRWVILKNLEKAVEKGYSIASVFGMKNTTELKDNLKKRLDELRGLGVPESSEQQQTDLLLYLLKGPRKIAILYESVTRGHAPSDWFGHLLETLSAHGRAWNDIEQALSLKDLGSASSLEAALRGQLESLSCQSPFDWNRIQALQVGFIQHLLKDTMRIEGLFHKLRKGRPRSAHFEKRVERLLPYGNAWDQVAQWMNEGLMRGMAAMRLLPSAAELRTALDEGRDAIREMPAGPQQAIQQHLCDYFEHLVEHWSPGRTARGWFTGAIWDGKMRELTRNASHRDLQVYDPNSNDHNWGMNYVWVLGLIRRGVNVVFASPVVERYMIRAKPPLHLAGPHPSAFAMEMVLVLMAGYSLNYDALTDQITLKARPHSVELMRSLDGMPMSPTHQIEIYQRVARAIRDSAAKGLSIENWILPEVLYRMNAQQLEAEAHLGAYNDFGIASSPHATSELLASIASRTPAAGPVIAANPNTNAQVLAAIVAAGAAYDEIVASYRNIAATELAVIAGRTPAAWKAVAANANTAPHTLNAIVAAGSEHDVIVASNRNTAAEQLTIIARRSPAAHKAIAENFNADIQALSFVLKASAAHDMALVHHPHLTVLQLNTIAERTPAARVAAALHPNIRGGKHWMRQ